MPGDKVSISKGQWALGLAVSLVLSLLQIRAIAGPYEDWPFSSAPMFARYQSRKAPLYYIEWWVQDGGPKRLIMPERDLGVGELPFRRGYFAAYYGSVDERHPSGPHRADDPSRFAERQADFCQRLRAAFRRRGGSEQAAFSLEVSERVAGSTRARRVIGTCDARGFRGAP